MSRSILIRPDPFLNDLLLNVWIHSQISNIKRISKLEKLMLKKINRLSSARLCIIIWCKAWIIYCPKRIQSSLHVAMQFPSLYLPEFNVSILSHLWVQSFRVWACPGSYFPLIVLASIPPHRARAIHGGVCGSASRRLHYNGDCTLCIVCI
jgi:hypothetical protein